ncbi:glyoxylase-like metal-dependent hydrolase (beta-lactamase superfamily II) [Nocardioides zeae]|uniref:Glyoxylase-like metal-dependent hydrolase (Beta-lactamase superfamily II) n=1 Tax=Nocardioides zeae TaxID=1457234 RepID=A0ACC6IGN5_9ACTN|nr:MBL fold metallo-hydrolase [Nocardioides zeae]MDR6172839.1 glyoxylase-like metal-dependent hydrolase (beta-lactamase superfamily II) [Nocardioides zeae]MDR6209849.1 glyoxylase-like metal-dependent hydrolase (beta-lactamase superfamily II) [Nocardioides zeae]
MQDGTFTEVADRVWVARHAWYDVNVALVAGAAGAVLVDTLASERAAAGLVEQVRRVLAPGTPLRAVVATHEHHDHVLGNGTVLDAWPDAVLVGHETAAERIPTSVPAQLDAEAAATPDDPRLDEMRASRVVAPTTTFSGVHVVDLGDRHLELLHPGRGHTAGDLVVRVPDADVLVAGDLVEALPAYGPDSHPLEWPGSLELLLGLLSPASVVVPGHGAVTDRESVAAQHDDVARVAATIAELAGRGVPASAALTTGDWPYPREALEHAVRRGYAHLPPGAVRLPLL